MAEIGNSIERLTDKFGILRGPTAVAWRLVIGFVIGALFVACFKSLFGGVFYDDEGSPYPFVLFASDEQKAAGKATNLPWWSMGVLGAFILGGLI